MTDTDLKQNVEKALEWEPSVDASDIGVAVDAGVGTLRVKAERAAWAAPGVIQVDDRLAIVP